MAILETWQKVDVAAVQNWMSQPQRLAKITTISLQQKDMGDDAAALFAALTLRCGQLRTLRLSGNAIGDIGAGCLAESLKLLPPLQTLDLSDNCLTATGATHLARIFFGGDKAEGPSKMVQLPRILDLSRNSIEDHGVAGVARCVPNDVHVRNAVLRLRGVSCGSQALPELLAHGAALLGLDVGDNALGYAGAVSTLTATKRKKWRSLSISNIGDGSQGGACAMGSLARPLADCLTHGALTDLECGQNALGEHACCQVVEALGKCSPRLLRLAMPATGFGLRACGALGQAFWPTKGGSTLRVLDLCDNQLVDVSIELLSNGLCRCPSLQEVLLANNEIGCRGTTVLASALHAQRRLVSGDSTGLGVVTLTLSGNPVGNLGAKALAEVAAASTQDTLPFRKFWGLEILDLRRTQVTREGCDALSAAVAARLALLDAASRVKEEEVQHHLLERFGTRAPSGLKVLGVDGLSTETSDLEQAARSRFSILWPEDDGSRRVVDLWTEEDSISLEVDSPRQELGDFSFLEGYFGGPKTTVTVENPSLVHKVEPVSEEKVEKNKQKSDKEVPTEKGAATGGAKGKGKAAPAKGPAVAPPKGKGKSGPGQAKGKGKEAAGKSRGEGKGEAKAAPTAPFGRRMHWVHPRYNDLDHDTIFDDGAIDFDADTLASLLRGEGGPSAKKKAQVKKHEGIKVLDASRAQNMAIVLSKLPVSSHDLCDALLHLDFSLALSEDLVELLSGVLPTPEECEKLKVHHETPEVLRDIEQKVLPFCFLPRAQARLRLLRLASCHRSTAQSLLHRCEMMGSAAKEAKCSTELRQLFAVILRIGNYINHGSKNGDVGAARGFAIETLPAITSFKLGTMSTLQFLCLTFRRSQPKFLEALLQSLPHVSFAAREKSGALKSSIQQFHQELEFATRELHQLSQLVEGEELAKESMKALVQELEGEVEELTNALETAFDRCIELQKYFCTEDSISTSSPVFENFFQCLQEFLETLKKAWRESEPPKVRSSARGSTLTATGKVKAKAAAGSRRSRVALDANGRRLVAKDAEKTSPASPEKAACSPPSPLSTPSSPPLGPRPAEAWKHLDADVESLLDHIFQPKCGTTPSPLKQQVPDQMEGDSFDVDDLIDSIFDE